MTKRVCFLTDSVFAFGGVQRVTAVIAKALAADCHVTIVTMDAPEAHDRSLYGLDCENIEVRHFSYPAVGRIRRLLCKAYSGLYRKAGLRSRRASDLYARSSLPRPQRLALTRELQAGHYDAIVGVHATLAARLATLKPQLGGARCVGWVHNSFEALFGPGSLYIGPDRCRHYVQQFMKLDATVVLCEHDARVYEAYEGRFRPMVIYNPLTLQPGAPSEGRSKRFLAVGRFSHRHKGFDVLIEAFHRFAQKDADWVLDIVGEGPEEELYRDMIARYGLQQRVLLHPFTRNIQQYYGAAQVYVLSSRWEGFGLVLVEAMAHGLPVVSSDLPTSLEIMGPFGLYFRNGDAEALAQRLLDATKIDWPEKAREALLITRRFDVAAIAAQWRKLLLDR